MKPKTVRRVETGQSSGVRAHAVQTGLVAGSIVFTSDGEIPVEYLSPGDKVVTRDAGMVTLKDVSSLRVLAQAVSIKAGSLGHTRPEHNVILPAAQRILVRDWRAQSMFGKLHTVVEAGQLIDDEFICDLGLRPMLLVQLTFDKPHVIYADGLEVAVPLAQAVQSKAA